MAIFRGIVRSNTLGMDTGISVILPYDRPAENQQKPCKVLYLLHGLGSNNESWVRYSGIETYVREYGLAVVMPEVQKSFYTDMHYGLDYFTYITEELPKIINNMFLVSNKAEDTYIAGLSMGGYGALKCAFTYPDKYAGCGSFSGAVDVNILKQSTKDPNLMKEIVGVLGEELIVNPKDDLFKLSENLKEKLPTYISCGTEDYLYNDNVRFSKHLSEIGIDNSFEAWSGKHDWKFWDVSIQKFLIFLQSVNS